MVLFLKMWATHEEVKVVDPHNGLLSPYVLTLMVVHFLQVLPSDALSIRLVPIFFISTTLIVWNMPADSSQSLH